MNDEKLIGITEAARQVGISHSTLSRQVKCGQVRSHGGKVRLSEVLHDRDRNIDKSVWMFRSKGKPSKSGAGRGQKKDAPPTVHIADTTTSDAVHVKYTPYGVPLTPDLVRELGGVLKSDYPSDPVDVGIECIYVGMEMIESEVRCLRDALARLKNLGQ